jgi:DNA-binding helix-hairpin-helix protein with protein kinase domain
LALLIFHVLFGGRHPYSGVPLRSSVGDSLETDIKNFRYAYARDNQARGFGPPPRSIPVSMLPAAIESMIHLALTEKGASAGRPTAEQWVAALDGLRGRLRKCGASSMHVYPDHLSSCPWCALENKGVVYFVDLGATFTPTPSGFVLTQVWGLIQAVPAPPPLSLPIPGNLKATARPLPSNVPGKDTITIYRLVALSIGIGVMVAFPGVWLVGLIIGWVGWAIASNAGASELAAELSLRRAAKSIAQNEYDQLVQRAKKEAGPEDFNSRLTELARLKEELERLPQAEKAEIDNLHVSAQERQKQKFLSTCFIDNANIPGVGLARKAALRSFGIETAADVTRGSIMQVRGFGESLTRSILDWKASCERRFTFNPATAVSQSDRDAVRTKYAAKKASLERVLVGGALELQQLSQRAAVRLAAHRPKIDIAAQKLAQADADLRAASR